jgi:hypothetical protein
VVLCGAAWRFSGRINVAIVVDDLDAAVAFFAGLGTELEGSASRHVRRRRHPGRRQPGAFFIRDRDGKFPGLFDAVLSDAGTETVLSGVQMPGMNSIMERRVQACCRELPGRTLIWNQQRLLHALPGFGQSCSSRRPHQGIANARPLRTLPSPIREPTAASRSV